MTTTARAAGTRTPVLRVLIGAAAGVSLALAFPPVGLFAGWWAVPAFAALIACFRALDANRAGGWLSGEGAWVGLAAGLGFFLVLLQWLRVLGPDAWLALCLLCASFWAAVGALLPALLRRRWWPVTVPLLWMSMEAVRAWVPWGGFPWGRLAFAQPDTALVGWAVLAGPAASTLAVALAGTWLVLLWDAARARRWAHSLPAALGIGALIALGALCLGAGMAGPVGDVEPIAVVQGNVPRLGLDFNAQRRAVLDNHVEQTQVLAGDVAEGRYPQPVAVIWPENSSDIDPLRNADAAAQVDTAARAIDAPVLVGAIRNNPADPPRDGYPGTVLNVGLVWDPDSGPGQSYAKRHPVPFGEYLPFRDLLSRFISRFDRIPRDFAAGQEPGVLQLGPVPAGIVICFEIAYDDLVRDAIRAGGGVLVVQTNNATYGRTGQPEQQLAITRVQAVAAGRTTLVAATSGISAVIDPRGDVVWRTTEFTADSTVIDVAVRSGLTPAMRLGRVPELLAPVLLIGLLILGSRRGAPKARPARG